MFVDAKRNLYSPRPSPKMAATMERNIEVYANRLGDPGLGN